ncbi:DEAD/DEAH box helicase [Microbacterium sp. NPDC078428]|uniref:DEAD/DEAH box helicase n=1 Tax=Microbacterium sp. NPDC078428 TaxID=3364190 RepID=UPI0037CBC179
MGHTPRPPSTPPTWRDLVTPAPASGGEVPLALGVDLRRAIPGSSPWLPRQSEAATARTLRLAHDDLRLRVHPMRRSPHTGTWIKGDATWEVVRRPGGVFIPAQARWFAELYSIARDVFAIGAFAAVSEGIVLDGVGSGLLWQHLRAASALEIPLVGLHRSIAVALAESASSSIRISPRSDGALDVSACVVIDGAEVEARGVRPIGATGVYAVATNGTRIHVAIAELALDDPLQTLLSARGDIRVPAAEREDFLAQAGPRLGRRGDVEFSGGITPVRMPEPAPVLEVAHRPEDRVDVALVWDYPGAGRVSDAEGSARRDAPVERDRETEARWVRRISEEWHRALGDAFAPTRTAQGVRAAEMVTRAIPALERIGVRIETAGRRRTYRELAGDPHISVSTVESADPDWFDLGVIVSIDGRRIPFAPLFTALAQGRRKMLLADGGYFSLAHPALQRLKDLIGEAADVAEWETGPRLHRHQSALWAEFEDLADESAAALTWRSAVAGLRDVSRIPSTPIPRALSATLRPYQRSGFDWLAFLWRHRLGGILADDMGLGKTLQTLALVAHAVESGERRPFLVIAPTSVTSVWRDEAARFVPGLRVQTITETRGRRPQTVEQLAGDADIVVTSYAVLRLSASEFAPIGWAGVIVDEAQFVKNAQTKAHRTVGELRADAVYALTGTPLENSLADLWALLSLTAPGLFASARRFREDYIGPIEQGRVPENSEGGAFRAERLARLRRRIRPLVMRRTKQLVAPELPPLQEQVQHVELSAEHREIYDAVLQRERKKVLGLLDDLDRNRFIVFRSLTLLRLLSVDAGLVDDAHAEIGSAKLDALVEQLAEIASEGHRALVFSQFTSFLARVSRRLDAAGVAHTQLDGSTRDRDEVVQRFRSGAAPVFLISLKAGGFGLTLTEAEYVFVADPWWNPAAESQAIDRAHRIGQDRSVIVYRMIASDTIEEKVAALQARKARLFTAVMDDEELFARAFSADDIRALLES